MILLFFNLELKHIFQVHLLSNECIFLFYLVVLNWIIDRYYTLKIMIIWGGWKWRRTTQSDINFGLILLSCESVAVITSLETSLSQINCICHLIITSKHPPLTLMGILLSSEVNYFQLVNIFHCVPVFFVARLSKKLSKYVRMPHILTAILIPNSYHRMNDMFGHPVYQKKQSCPY